MKLIEKIENDELFKLCIKKNNECEKDRKFCKHGITHLLDTARIAYIMCLENNLEIDKEIIYAAALLHDCGRWKQYQDKIPHHTAGAEIAEKILKNAGCDNENIMLIISAINEHRSGNTTSALSNIIYKADKMSRPCGYCNAQTECNWNSSKRNLKIIY